MKIENCTSIVSGFAFKSNLFNENGDGIPIVRIRDVGKAKSNTYYSGEYFDDYVLKNGDFIIGMDGEFRIAEWKGGKALLNQRVCKIKPDEEKIFPKFLFYALPKKLKDIEDKTPFVTVKHLSVKSIKELKIPLPPLSTQKKKAAILDAADEYRQKTKALIEKYDQLAQSLFLEMFGDPVTNPKGWEMKLVGDVCLKIIGGGTPSKSKPEYYNGNVPWVTPKDMKFKYILTSIDKINQEAINNSSASLIIAQSVLMVIRSGILKKKLPVAINSVPVTINQDMKAFVPNLNFITTEFMYSFFFAVQSYLLSKVRAVTADNIEFKQIRELSIFTPPLRLQNQFAERVKLIEQQKQQAQASLKKAEDLFNSLLQRAFKGELVSE